MAQQLSTKAGDHVIQSKSVLAAETLNNFMFTKQMTCYFCGGFYGPCFGEPACATCHAFLFPEDINLTDEDIPFADKSEDGDSGNDEPTDFYYEMIKKEPRIVIPSTKSDKLAERITALTTIRDKDCVPEGLVELLPPEVLLIVFSYLDDISLWSVSQVCKRWRHLLESWTTEDQWRLYTQRRWPLFHPAFRVQSWSTLYTKLLESSPCKLCLQQMSIQTQPPAEENSWRRNRLRNELKSLRSDPPEGIEATPLDRMCCHWLAAITGPAGSPYEGGNFYLYLQIPNSYPMRPPVVRFITRILHPNISRHGDIGLDSIHHNWSLALTISKVLISIQSLLTDPYCSVCMEPEVGALYHDNLPLFDQIARLWTWKFAMNDYILPTKHLDEFWRSISR